jgi:hypothetical protein
MTFDRALDQAFDRAFDRPAPTGVDVSVAHSARVYDWWLGGKDNFAVDRELGQRIVDLVPTTGASCRANRAFLHRAARMIARAGVHQFLDLGAGLPTMDNTHAVVQRVDPANRVVYVDYDPLVLAHARALLAGYGPTYVAQADIRDPDAIVTHPEVTAVIDFTAPVCVLAVAVLHFITDTEDPNAIVNRLRQAMAPGSYLVLSHITSDGARHRTADTSSEGAPEGASDGADDDGRDAGEVLALMRKYMADPPTPRIYDEVQRFFDGFDLLDPGVVPVDQWRPDDETPAQTLSSGDEFWMYAGVGHKPVPVQKR